MQAREQLATLPLEPAAFPPTTATGGGLGSGCAVVGTGVGRRLLLPPPAAHVLLAALRAAALQHLLAAAAAPDSRDIIRLVRMREIKSHTSPMITTTATASSGHQHRTLPQAQLLATARALAPLHLRVPHPNHHRAAAGWGSVSASGCLTTCRPRIRHSLTSLRRRLACARQSRCRLLRGWRAGSSAASLRLGSPWTLRHGRFGDVRFQHGAAGAAGSGSVSISGGPPCLIHSSTTLARCGRCLQGLSPDTPRSNQ